MASLCNLNYHIRVNQQQAVLLNPVVKVVITPLYGTVGRALSPFLRQLNL